ncbi:delta 9 fatty acid desaturase [Cavenderia fasciculata]|uniref:Delta 9 fatty acid desaturase n=1 Tax=Cavenderia fasciculata TaxID=261658 RepID=F4PXG0_CACFS|nr:delta 9 fatty acid desaturase [Cavenderia fasciculata]EGG19470.1 delta 9 fatty acid desaturase [Cavenderia fasciculata]|eukprot:XP_004357764.1 delta 9 fatty acid desaturase [Cavenderia fasciculata]
MGSGNTAKTYPPVLYKKLKPIRKSPKELPQVITLEQIVESLPKEVFEKSGFKSFSSLFLTILFIALSIVFMNHVPSYLYPIGWFLGGASITGLFVIGNDCNHKSFSNSSTINSVVGTIVMLPLLYPFQSVKIIDRINLNNNIKSNASFIRNWATGKYFWLVSICNWAENYFNVKKVEDKDDKAKAFTSIVLVYVFAGIFFPLILKFFGISGFLNYWLAPWLIYHFLASTFTLLPRIPFFDERDKKYSVHITYPKWFEFVVKDINFTLPRQIAVTIPHYNLRKAYDAFKKNWGEYIFEMPFEHEMLKELITRSQSFSEEIFSPFDNQPIAKPTNRRYVPPTSQRKSRTVSEFLKEINWLHASLLLTTPVIAVYGMMSVSLTWKTFVWTFIYYHMTGMGITVGYHRLYSHRSYKATLPIRILLLLFGAGAIEGSCRWWSRDHRAHHRYTDTDKDPYSAHSGFFWSHFGWLMMKQDPSKIGRSNIEDLNADKWVMWQHRNYLPIAFFFGFVFPTLVAGLGWDDWMGGYFYAGVLRLVTVHHSTFFVNSLAHFIGDTPYDDNHSPKDSIITAILTFGEGYHNFHHEFPTDYRNAYSTFGYDPSKWAIKLMELLGLVYDLNTFSKNEIQKGMIQMRQKNVEQLKQVIHWGTAIESLPEMTEEDFDAQCKQGKKYIIIDSIVLDVETFIDEHPGGVSYIKMGLGKDATKMFRGEVYGHSNAANNLISQFRIARFISKEKNN